LITVLANNMARMCIKLKKYFMQQCCNCKYREFIFKCNYVALYLYLTSY